MALLNVFLIKLTCCYVTYMLISWNEGDAILELFQTMYLIIYMV